MMGEYITLKNGASVMYDNMGEEIDYIVYQAKGNSCHIYTGNNLESGADMEVVLYDNLNINVFGRRKRNPTIIIEGGEFPCTVVVKRHPNIIVQEEQ
jgi:hypothetical protein